MASEVDRLAVDDRSNAGFRHGEFEVARAVVCAIGVTARWGVLLRVHGSQLHVHSNWAIAVYISPHAWVFYFLRKDQLPQEL